MYNPIILVGSCLQHSYRGFHDAVRETWGKSPAITYKFLVGSTFMQPAKEAFGQPDTIVLPVPDGKEHLALKILEGIKWARKARHDFIFVAWNDTYCFTRRMEGTNWARLDYTGHFRGEEVEQMGKVALGCYASGGSGYWVSPYFSDRIVEEIPDHWADDVWMGRVAKKHGIQGTQDYRYFSKGSYKPEALTVHLSRGTGNYDPQWMRDTHEVARKRGEL